MKTGTPPRLDGRTIDYSQFEEQKGDKEPTFFSFRTGAPSLPQVSCHLGYTGERVHRLLRTNLQRSALYGGAIVGIGPRYCPSIEDKVVKFADRDRHQIFLEPEGLDTDEVYLNGMSTSMPVEIQEEMVHAVPGLEQARIVRPAYAIEYDFVDPTELEATLETRRMRPSLSRGPDQRHHRIRGSGRTGAGRRDQCRAARARPRRRSFPAHRKLHRNSGG